VGFAVEDAQASQQALSQRGLGFVDPQPRRTRIFMRDFAGRDHEGDVSFSFSRPSSLAGVLLEFIQYPPGFALGGSAAGGQEGRS
jgi:hypothetical protein